MDVILRTGFEKVNHSITFQPESVPKGIKLVESGHVQRVEEFRRDEQNYIITKSKVIRQASVSETPYSTSLRLDLNRRITGTSCDRVHKDSCKCKHVAALVHFVNNEESISKTSYEQSWEKPSLSQLISEKYSKGAWLSQLFKYSDNPSKEHIPLNVLELLEEVDNSSLRQMVSNINSCQVEPVLAVEPDMSIEIDTSGPEPEENDCGVCFDNFTHFSSEYPVYGTGYILASPLKEFYESYVALPLSKLRKKFCQTVNQSQCNEGHDFRKLRLSASSDVHLIKIRTKKIRRVISHKNALAK